MSLIQAVLSYTKSCIIKLRNNVYVIKINTCNVFVVCRPLFENRHSRSLFQYEAVASWVYGSSGVILSVSVQQIHVVFMYEINDM
jgi:hypothetical protein